MTTTFPHNSLTAIHGKPTPQALQRLKKELIANAMSVPSTRGGGLHGHLAIILSDYDYELIAGQPFDKPVHPGPPPNHAINATNAQIHAADTTYNRAIEEFQTYNTTSNALRALLITAVESNYYNILNDPLFGYANTTPREIFEHLDNTYGTISTKDLEKNREALKAPWNPDDDITSLWTRIKECQDFARHTAEAISDNTAMLLTLEALTASGVMSAYINEWKRKESVDQTYANFKLHFDKANKVRIEELTSKQAGFHTANSVSVTPTTDPAALRTVAPAPAPASTDAPVRVDGLVKMYYCWTHGLGWSWRHTSKSCKNPGTNHQYDATILDMKNGCRTIQTEPLWKANRNRPKPE